MDTRDIYSFVAQQRYGVVSSLSATGTPQSALVGIAATPELEIIFDTVKSSRKYGNLVARPRCSFVIGWAGEQTVQLEGIAIEPGGTDLESYQRTYFAAWPDGPARMSWPGLTYFVVKPRWVRFSDYDQRPPVIEEIAFSQDVNAPKEYVQDTQPQFGTAPDLTRVLAELEKREPLFHRPEFGTLRKDFESMMAEDFWEVGASGNRYSREYVLDTLEKRHAAVQERDIWETQDFRCRRLGSDTYLLTYRLLQGRDRWTRRATVWQQGPNGWRAIYHQGTLESAST